MEHLGRDFIKEYQKRNKILLSQQKFKKSGEVFVTRF